MDRVRELAASVWRRNLTGWAEKYLMERLSKAEGDVDGWIAVHAADLAPDGSTHLSVARELDTVGCPDEALRWAESGIEETPVDVAPDIALIDCLCDLHPRRPALRGRRPAPYLVRRPTLPGRPRTSSCIRRHS